MSLTPTAPPTTSRPLSPLDPLDPLSVDVQPTFHAPAIELTGVTKAFGSLRALDTLNLSVEHNECFGFIGANGAGKSTTMRILVDLIRPTSGSVRVLGGDPRTDGRVLRERIGYLPGEPSLPGNRTSRSYLSYLSSLRGGRGRGDIEPLAERFHLDLGRRMGKLSKGNRQKVALIQAFMGQPDLLLLDEPTSGLDPVLQHEFHGLLAESIRNGATAVVSSHVLQEIEGIADRVGIIRSGSMVAVGSVADIRQRAGQRVEFRVTEAVGLDDLAGVPGIDPADVLLRAEPTGGTSVSLVLRDSPDALIHRLARFTTTAIVADYEQLEDLVVDLYREESS